MPTADEFAAWLKVEFWILGAFLVLLALEFLGRVGLAVGSTLFGGLGDLLPYVVGFWVVVVAVSVWYTGRLRGE